MPMNKIPRLREPRGPIVQQIRDQFLEQEYKVAPDDFYPQDIRLVENMDFLLQRCVIMNRKEIDPSVKMVSQLLKWRKERKLYDLNRTCFPQELGLIGAAFIYENDKFGNRVLYLRGNLCRSCNELKQTFKDFLTFLIFQLDDAKDGTTYAVVLDLTKASWSNYDIDLLMHFVNLLKDYFPVNLDYVLAVNFPWIFKGAWAIVKRLIPAEKRDIVQFIGSDQMTDFIAEENIPDFLGGTCEKPYKIFIDEAPSSFDYVIQNSTKSISKKRLLEMLAMFAELLPEDHVQTLRERVDQLADGIKVDDRSFNNNNDVDEVASS